MAASRRGSTANIFSASKSNLKPAQVKEEAVVKEEKIEEVKVEEPAEKKKAEPKESNTKVELKEEEAPKEKSSSKTKKSPKKSNIFITKKSHGKGCAKSIYLQGDVYEYLSSVANEYELSLSDVVNQLVRHVMEGE